MPRFALNGKTVSLHCLEGAVPRGCDQHVEGGPGDDVEINVTNLWVNRLIGDEQPGVAKKYTYTTADVLPGRFAFAALRASGAGAGPENVE